jgi:hypothetical protein
VLAASAVLGGAAVLGGVVVLGGVAGAAAAGVRGLLDSA